MIQALPEPITFDEFIAWYPENSGHRYELHYGVIVEMPKPTGKHSRVAGFSIAELNFEIRRNKLPYFIPKECVLKPRCYESGYEPDVIVLDDRAIENDPRWERESIITTGTSVRLAIEVVSTNWSDDYALKLEEYEGMEIPEYWIVDYLGLGGRRYIGSPKQPTLTVYQLVDGEYQGKQFRGNERIESLAFPELDLTAVQVFAAGQVIS
ncbi:Uma2 family endonuclease [Lusitaniella coriacea LEGE 07157]|uniref:Uma2 family endonuclease n=1 Tax=Lusitaniella coriacea LEGE 07157 TaxID=945747 RepID=A0A8J7B7E2_9CYAN|nr:Uma2 family endonuclease [Lusitaniella coriacea]MBE9115186.1 Uma2 family endonuclease [Lusitaniella coriacea LEGE 07157]